MALIICKECGREISEFASACPHCGYPLSDVQAEQISASSECVLDEPQENMESKHEPESPSALERSEIISTPKKSRNPLVISIVAVCLIAAVVAIVLVKNAGEKKAQTAREERNLYIQTLKDVRFNMVMGAAKAESLYNLTRAVWYNTIYEKSDPATDKYTKSDDGSFFSDFNTSLVFLLYDDETIEKVDEIKANQEDVEADMKKLQNPPEGLEECYKTVMDLYDCYKNMTGLAISPSGSLQSYTEDFRNYDSSFMTLYDRLGLQLP